MQRQGDLLFIPITRKRPRGKLERDRTILVRGEASGHAHAIRERGLARVYSLPDGSLEIYPLKGRAVPVDHEEHDTVTLTGPTRVVTQWEYDPAEAERLRRVAD
jgi:hypothetical protein